MKYKKIFLIVGGLCGCGQSNTFQSEIVDGIDLQIDFSKSVFVEKNKVSYIFGNVVIKSTAKDSEVISVDVDCLELSINGKLSTGVYFDSIAHILKENYVISSSSDAIKLYWVFDGEVAYSNESKVIAQIPGEPENCFVLKSVE